MHGVYINRIGAAVPAFDVHDKFVAYAPSLLSDPRSRRLFERMAERAEIEHRYSCIEPDPSPGRLDRRGLFQRGRFPDTWARMRLYEEHAFGLARRSVEDLGLGALQDDGDVTHLIVTSCTGFYAPGLDLQVAAHLGLDAGVERTVVGFMGCQAALNALKLARHIVRSEPQARVLVLNLELCTLHLQETDDLEQVLSFLIFADGCAASLVTAEPVGLELESFHSAVMPESADQITWHIGRTGFDMVLSGRVPRTIGRGLSDCVRAAVGGRSPDEIELWAVHPGGRSVLDAVEEALHLPDDRLRHSREVLRRFGNMSSPTVMFVLKRMLDDGPPPGGGSPALGCALAFGPGLTAESMVFRRITSPADLAKRRRSVADARAVMR